MADTGAKVENLGGLLRELGRLESGVTSRLTIAVDAGLRPITNAAKEDLGNTDKHPHVTGNLARSITQESELVEGGAIGRSGTNVEYAEEEELRPGHSYLRKAVDENLSASREEIITALRELIRSSV